MRPGFPVLEVEAQCHDGTTAVSLAQRRYVTGAGTTAADGTPWPVPVCLRYPTSEGSDAAVRCELLDTERHTISIGRCIPWVVANASGRGYFRTFYDEEDAVTLAASGLSPSERLALVADETVFLPHESSRRCGAGAGAGNRPYSAVRRGSGRTSRGTRRRARKLRGRECAAATAAFPFTGRPLADRGPSGATGVALLTWGRGYMADFDVRRKSATTSWWIFGVIALALLLWAILDGAA